jgi:hypothetical protein
MVSGGNTVPKAWLVFFEGTSRISRGMDDKGNSDKSRSEVPGTGR